MLHVLRFPPIYALAAALLTVWVRGLMSEQTQELLAGALRPFWDTVSIVSRAFVPVALATLGAQLAALRGDGVRYPLRLSVLGRLLMGPAIAFVMLWTMGIHGLVGQVLLISTSTPTAVNCMLICMEFDNHPDFVAKSVFYSTLLSPITVSLTILLAQSGALG
jgi:predicted permease